MQPKDYEELPDKNPSPSAPPGGVPKAPKSTSIAKVVTVAIILGTVVYLVFL